MPDAKDRALRVRTLLVLLAALACGPAAGPRAARANIEEFSTFSPEAQEEDGESFIDHVLMRLPVEWRDEWERAPLAFRTTQACVSSSQWAMDTRLKLSTPLGDRARFAFDYHKVEDDVQTYETPDLWFLFPREGWTLGGLFRPYHDKSRQDFALRAERGADSTAWHVQATFVFEDLFNNLWAWRQNRVGEKSEPYERHPWEPELKVATHQKRWRVALEGKYLTPSRKFVQGYTVYSPPLHQDLWGTWGSAALEADAAGLTWLAGGSDRQAASSAQPAGAPDLGDGRDFRRQWTAEAGVRAHVHRRVLAEAHYYYQDRYEGYREPLPVATFHAIDRALHLETRTRIDPRWTFRLGWIHDRVTVDRTGDSGVASQGTRIEPRIYFGLLARFGRVSISGLEGLKLDREQYETLYRHDHGFVQIQAVF